MPPTALPIACGLSAAVCIAAGLGALPRELFYVFKPLTTLIVIAWAATRGRSSPAQRRRIVAGLWLSLAGDVCLMWPAGFLPGLIAFLLAHLAYIAAYSVPVRFGAKPWVFVLYGGVAVAILSQLWGGVPAGLRVPVIGYVVCLACMAAQAAAWWRSDPGSRRALLAAVGGAFFMASDSLLAINKFAAPLPASALWVLSTYWVAQLCIAASLPADRRPQ